MDKAQQAEFTTELIETVKDGILLDLDKVPSDWDGAELRAWIAERFTRHTVTMPRNRESAYNNDVLVNNL